MNRRVLRSSFELLATDYVQLNKSWNYKDVTSSFYRLYYIDEGEGKLFNVDSSVTMKAGGLYLVPAFTNCNYSCDDYLSQYYICFKEESPEGSSLFFNNRKLFALNAGKQDIAIVKQLLRMNPGRNINVSYNPKVFEKENVLKGLGAQNEMIPLSVYVENCGLLLQLIARFLSSSQFSVSNQVAFTPFIADSIYYIQTNLSKPVTVAALAKRVSKHPDYFSRLFFNETGELPLEFIHNKKIAQAQLLLITSYLPVSEIADRTGFQSLSYFIRIFKRVTGQTPGEYKRNNPVVG